MKALLVVLCALCVTWSGLALAGGQPSPDQIGVYFDETGDGMCSESVTGMFDAYLVLTELSSSSIGGWEVKITTSGGGVLTSATPRGLAIDAASRDNEYIVGLGTPMYAVNGALVVMDLSFYVFDTLDPFYVYVGPVYYHTTAELLPAYLDGADLNVVKPLTPSQGTIEDPVLMANVNCTGPVENQTSSWGEVKSIFR